MAAKCQECLGQFVGNSVKLIDYPELVDILFANKVLNFA